MILTLICRSTSEPELNLLIQWAHERFGSSQSVRVTSYLEPDSNPKTLSVWIVQIFFSWSWSDLEKKRLTVLASIHETTPLKILAASLLTEVAHRTPKKLYAFDMDSTFIDQEVIDELGRELGLYESFASITESAMQGKLDYVQALHDRVQLLRGLSVDRAHQIVDRLSLSPGVEQVLRRAKREQAHTMIVSGGFDFVLRYFQLQLGIDEIHAHHLKQDSSGLLTGTVQGPIIDAERKRHFVMTRRNQLGLHPDEVVVVGDGANDIQMLNEASMKVSFQGKDALRSVANTWIRDRDYRWLEAILDSNS